MEEGDEVQFGRQPQRGEAEAAHAEPRPGLGVGAAAHHERHGDCVRILGEQAGGHGVDEVAVEGGLDRDLRDRHLITHLVTEQFGDGVVELLLVAGDESAVDAGGRPSGDHVQLVAGVQHRRVGRVRHGGADHPGDRAEPGEGLLGIVGADLDAEHVLDGVEELPLRGMDPRRPAVVADPGDRLGEAGDGVVVVAHRAVAGRALRDQVQPGDALLGGLDEVEPPVVAR